MVCGNEEASQEQRSPVKPRKQQRPGEEEGVDADVTDLIIQEHLKLSAQLEARLRDFESSRYLHSVPTKRERHRERDAKRRQVLQRQGGNQARHRKRKPTHLVLQRDAETHREDPEDREWRIEPSGPGEGRGVEDAQD